MVVATHNSHKLKEIRRILSPSPRRILGLEGFPAYEVRETGKTLEANALLKARAAVRRTGLPALSDDSGLEVWALAGQPGVFSARYAGPRCSFDDNNRKLLKELGPRKGPARRGVFRCVVALVTPEGLEKLFEGRVAGRITEMPRGSQGFGYDPVFQPLGHRRTFAEMTLKEKNSLSHRARAFRRAADFLRRHPSL